MKGNGVRVLLTLVLCSGTVTFNVGSVSKQPRQYSVWLVPSGAQYDSLHTLVCDLASRYPSHCFIPHVTVVGDVTGTLEDITQRAERLARRTRVIETHLTSIGWKSGDYFRSFYVLIDETRSLSGLYNNTCSIVGKCQTRPYHMSLMYTDKLSDSAKVAIRDSLYAGRGGKSYGGTMRLTRLLVCFTTGLPPEQWTCPRAIELQ